MFELDTQFIHTSWVLTRPFSGSFYYSLGFYVWIRHPIHPYFLGAHETFHLLPMSLYSSAIGHDASICLFPLDQLLVKEKGKWCFLRCLQASHASTLGNSYTNCIWDIIRRYGFRDSIKIAVMGTCSSARSAPLKSFDLNQDHESTCYIWLFAKAFYQKAYGKNHSVPIGL